MVTLFWFNLFVFLNVLLLVLLALNISRLRLMERVPNGDGGKVTLKKAIRAHGNGVEHVTLVGLVLLALEFSQAPGVLLGTLVIGFSAARLLHGAGMLGSSFNARRVAAAATYVFELGGVVAVLMYGVMR